MIRPSEKWMQQHLERVSRSFAFCIARLEEPLRHQVGLAYLICRILDSVEDSEWLGDTTQARINQSQAFDSFISFLKFKPETSAVNTWSADLISKVKMPESETHLVRDAHLVFELFWAERPRVREVMTGPIESMARGMAEFRGLALRCLRDVNRYCFFVAGVVGEILTGLVRLIAEDRGEKVVATLAEGFRFGLFLQKVNLLKDRETDLKEGRDLVPSRIAVFKSSFEDARKAFSYLVSIPTSLEGYRLFCGWSLFLGLASLPHIAGRKKIGRLETVALLAAVERRVRSNTELESMFCKYLEKAQFACDNLAEEESVRSDTEARKISDGNVRKSDLVTQNAIELHTYRRSYVGQARDEDLIEIIAATR